MSLKRVSAAVLGLCFGTVLVGAALAAVNEREDTMKQIAHGFRPLVQMFKSNTFNQAEAMKQASAIAADFDHFKTLFPTGTEQQDDKARPEIWTDRAGFETALGNAKKAALQIASASSPADFQASVRALGSACGACHDKYRHGD